MVLGGEGRKNQNPRVKPPLNLRYAQLDGCLTVQTAHVVLWVLPLASLVPDLSGREIRFYLNSV